MRRLRFAENFTSVLRAATNNNLLYAVETLISFGAAAYLDTYQYYRPACFPSSATPRTAPLRRSELVTRLSGRAEAPRPLPHFGALPGYDAWALVSGCVPRDSRTGGDGARGAAGNRTRHARHAHLSSKALAEMARSWVRVNGVVFGAGCASLERREPCARTMRLVCFPARPQ